MHIFDIDKLPREIYGQLVDDEALKDQIVFLDSPGGRPSTRKLIDYAERGLIHSPAAGRQGGKSVKRLWFPWGSSMFDVGSRLAAHLSLAQVAEVAGLASFLWASAGDLRALLAHAFEFSGKSHYEQPIAFWLSIFSHDLKMLYPDRFDAARLDYFSSKSMLTLIFGLTHGFVEGYTLNKNGNLIPPKKQFNPEKSLKGFMSAEPPMSLFARPRE